MRKFLYTVAVILLTATLAHAQATVTGTVVDSNGNPYANGTVAVQSVVASGQPAFFTSPSSLTNAGVFSVVLPAPATYVFTLCAPPVGIGPLGNPTPVQVCFSSNPILITVSTDVTSSLTPLIKIIGPKIGGGGGNSSSASGTSVLISPTCTGSSSTCFVGKFDVHWGTTPTFTSGSNIVTCGDCNFTSTDVLGRSYAVVGQIAWGTTATNDVTMGTSVLATPECVIQSVDSNTQVHLGTIVSPATPCNATQNTTSTGRFIWGDLDSATSSQTQATANDPLFAAWTAASNSCAQLRLPAGATFIEQSEFVTYPTGQVCGKAGSTTGERFGFSITGAGVNATFIIPTPNFLSSTCTGPNGGGVTCLLAMPNPTWSQFSVYGEGNSACGVGFNGKNLVQVMGDNTFSGTNGLISQVKLLGWCSTQAGTKGLVIGSGNLTIAGMDTYDLWVENFGCNGVVTNSAGSVSNQISWNGGSYWNNGNCGPALTINGPITFKSNKSYNGTLSGNSNKIVSILGGTYFSNEDILVGSNTACIINFDSAGGAAYLTNDVMNSNLSNAICALNSGNTGTAYLTGNQTTVGIAGRYTFSGSGATLNIYDNGGNTEIYTGSVSQNGTGILNWYNKGNGDTIKAGCTGVVTASQTLGLYGTGPNVTATTCTSTTIGSGIVMQNTGTIINLLVTSTAAGVNASSGVVTVIKNGSTQTLTCTIGTGTSCSDATHQISYIPGDLISIQFTTQAADTLAGVKATIVAN